MLLKKTVLVILLSLGGVINSFAQKPASTAQIETVLNNAQRFIQNIRTISYKSSYKQISFGEADSVLFVSGQVWMELVPADSIFSARFHIKGEMKNAFYDYFYDGINSYEVNHSSKEIDLTNPRLFANDEHNPSKARVAVLPFNYYLTSKTFKDDLLKINPKLSMLEQAAQYIITLDYPIDKYGDKKVTTLYLDRKSFAIKQISTKSDWNGSRFQEDKIYSDIVVNNEAIIAQIPVSQTYKDYVITETKPRKSRALPALTLSGKPAINFNYKTFDNKQIALADLKGKYVLLDFWETWCGWCIMALPKMELLHQKYKDKGLVVLSVTSQSPAKVNELRKANKLTYPGLMADKNIINDYKVTARPTYVLIDTTGKIMVQTEGDLETIEKKISESVN